MGYWGISPRRTVAVSLIVAVIGTACAMSSDEGDTESAAGSPKGTSSDIEMPNGIFTGDWPDDPGDFANNPRATGSFAVITVDVSGSNWTIETSYATTVPVGGKCFSTVTHTIEGTGPIIVDAGGPQLLGEVSDQWVRERGGDGCPNPRSDEGEDLATVSLTYKDNGLEGWIEGHNVTLIGG